MTSAHGSPSTARLASAEHALLVLAVVACRILLVPACPTYDDAFITYRYAESMAGGSGLVFNPGAAWEPVLGTTTPLYALILALFARLGADLVSAALVFNIALDAVTAILIPRLFARARLASTVALVAFAALPPLARISVGGMESPLFSLLGLAAALALASGASVTAGTCAALACVTRPEGVLLCGVLFLARVRSKRELVRFTLPVVAVGVIAITWLVATYGSPIPQSVTAKATMREGDALREALVRSRLILSQSFLPYLVLLPALPLVLGGAWHALRGGGALRFYSLWSLAITASYLIARPHTWGWYYCVPLTAWVLWFGLGAARSVEWIAQRFGTRSTASDGNASAGMLARFGPPLAAVVALAAAALVGERWRSPVTDKVYRPMAAWAQATSTREPTARILASDIGAIGWHWHGTVLDSEGLVWPEALAYKTPNAIIEALRPEYVLLVAERGRLAHWMSRPDLFALYEPVARFSALGRARLDPAPEDLEVDWTQDYLVYRRRSP